MTVADFRSSFPNSIWERSLYSRNSISRKSIFNFSDGHRPPLQLQTPRDREPQLPGKRNADAALEHVVIDPLDLVEDRTVNRAHESGAKLRAILRQRDNARLRCGVKSAGATDLE